MRMTFKDTNDPEVMYPMFKKRQASMDDNPEPGIRITDPKGSAPYEKVDHPKHYNEHPAGIECVDVVEEMSFNLGNAVKYIWRAGLKPDSKNDEDLAKAEWYLKRERQRLAKRPKT